MQWGEEVAVKLIRRGNIDTSARMSKVEREIEVLRALKHPNIVRLYDVIETDKYIGIILEYASGGELFDHILAHRYLKEKDACKLFSQLVSGVWYIHQKKIVHRDLKLENLLLDRHRNVIITDFGFANRFEHKADELMQTSCGSPCYAAPELVISDGMYVGSAVDIWSCGVILYAMLAGYLPFDDDPANPDGDNINLLYKYIVNTPLSFPDYISAEARDLLSLMLVPDPKKRADIQTVMNHRWLRPSAALFGRTLADLEHAAMEQHQQKRLAYQRQMKAAATDTQRMARSQSARTDGYANSVGVLPSSSSRSRSNRDYGGPHSQQQVPLYETSNDQAVYASSPSQQQINATVPSRRGATSQIVLPSASPFGVDDDDPFAQTPSREKPETDFVISPVSDGLVDENTRRRQDSVSKADATPTSSSKAAATTSNGTRKVSNAGVPPQDQGQRRKKDDFRHTIQVEYNDTAASESQLSQSQSSHRQPPQEKPQPIYPIKASEVRTNGTRRVSQSKNDTTPKKPASQSPSSPSTPTTSDIPKIKALPPTPQNNTPRPRAASNRYTTPPDLASSRTTQPTIEITAPLSPTSAQPEANGVSDLNISINGTGSQSAKSHRTGPSLDKIGFAKLFGGSRSTQDQTNGTKRSTTRGPTTMGSRQTSESDVPSDASATTRPRRPSTMQVTPTVNSQSGNALSQSQTSNPGTQDGGGRSPQLLSPVNSSSASATSSKKNRRNTLTVMVEPFSRTIKQRTKSGRGTSREPSSKEGSAGDKSREPSDSLVNQEPPKTAVLPPRQHHDNKFPEAARPGVGNAASTSKAKKVMDWFRTKSRGRVPEEEQPITEKTHPTPSSREVPLNASTSTINGVASPSMNVHPPTTHPDMTTPRSTVSTAPGHPSRTPSVATDKSFTNPIKRSFILSPAARNILRVHHGAVDQTTITSGNPPEVMRHVLDVLFEMGLEVQEESQYKYRCIRPKKRKIGSTGVSLNGQGGNGLAAFSMVGSAASGGVDKRGLPIPSSSGGMLKGLLMRRQSSQVSNSGSQPVDSESSSPGNNESSPSLATPTNEQSPSPSNTLYGDQNQDQGGEVRFSVELTRLDRLEDTYSLDIRRLKGNLKSYKFLYDSLRERANLSSDRR